MAASSRNNNNNKKNQSSETTNSDLDSSSNHVVDNNSGEKSEVDESRDNANNETGTPTSSRRSSLIPQDDNRPSKNFWWDALMRNMGERQLAVKSVTAIAALITAILWMAYKFYWKSRNNGNHANSTNVKRKTSKLASLPLWWSWWWWQRSRKSNNNATTNYTSAPRGSSTQVVPLSSLMQAAKTGTVERVLFRASQIWFQTKTSGNSNKSSAVWQTAHLPSANQYNSQQLQSDLMDLLQRSGATISALPDSIWQKLATPALAALPFVYLALLYRMMHKLQHGDNDTTGTTAATNATTSTTTTFADVAGLDHVLTEVAEVVQYLHHPEAYHGVGARPPRAILLHGPPGSGKTLLARAVAGEAHTLFYACSASEFVETYVGRGAARVRSVFRNAKRQAKKLQQSQRQRWPLQTGSDKISNKRTATAILFIDELDALAKTRSSGLLASSNDERDQTLNQLLTEMDGFYQTGDADHDDVTIIVMAATNRADVLDPAILRRFDRQVHVGYPDAQGRKAILLVHAKKIKCDAVDDIRWDYLASDNMTPNFSGADLRNVINEAALLAVRDHSDTVQEQHLLHATQRIRDMKKHLQQPSHLPSSHRQFIPPFSLDEFH